MKIDVRFRGLEPSDALREHAVRRAHFHLSRFGQEISSVVVRIGDVNGPRGGVDKRCQITVRGPRIGASTLDELGTDVGAALDVALDRTARAVGRELERTRESKHTRPSPRPASS